MTPKLILSSEGTLKYVAEWPENLNSINYFFSILNAVPFKNKEDEQKIKLAILHDEITPHAVHEVPKGFEIETKYLTFNEADVLIQDRNKIGRFAFIVHEPKEEAESQYELWREANREARNGSLEEIIERQRAKFRIERIK